jgi:hypothetical protein
VDQFLLYTRRVIINTRPSMPFYKKGWAKPIH